jgi:hypothetical protein
MRPASASHNVAVAVVPIIVEKAWVVVSSLLFLTETVGMDQIAQNRQ